MLETHVDGPVATLTLNRPQARNALSPALLSLLVAECGALADHEQVQVVVLRGAGGTFSAGADLMAFAPELAAGSLQAADLGRRAVHALAGLPQITVAYVRGPCVGGGMVLASVCDLRLASSDARFWLPEVQAGIPVAWGGMAPLHRVLGEPLLMDLVLTGRRLDAAQALQVGFVIEVTDEPSVVSRLAAAPASTLRAVKRQMLGLRSGTFDPEHDARDLLAAVREPAVVAAMQAYLASRRA